MACKETKEKFLAYGLLVAYVALMVFIYYLVSPGSLR